MTQSTLVRFAYEVAANPQKRSDFVAAFAEVIDAKAAAVAVEDRQLRWARLLITHGMDQGTIDSYCSHYMALNPWALRRPLTAGGVRRGMDVLSEAEFRDTEFYHGWYKPRGWLYPFSITLYTTETECIYIFAVRPPNHPFTEKEMAIVNDLAPHLATAAQIGKTLADLKNTIDRLRTGAREFDILTGRGLKPHECHIALTRLQGQSVKEIARKTGRSPETVRSHVKSIYRKLGVHDRAELMRLLHDLFRQ
jgi:DNA-binding CsgD family transcriptional regulator